MDPKAPTRPRPLTLHDIVVDYVVNSGYAGTAKVLAATGRPGMGTSSAFATPPPDGGGAGVRDSHGRGVDDEADEDEDGDEADEVDADADADEDGTPAPVTSSAPALDDAVLASIDQRRAILDYILSGAIERAADALQTHFPSVLNPSGGGFTNGAGRGSNGAESNGSGTAHVVRSGAGAGVGGTRTPASGPPGVERPRSAVSGSGVGERTGTPAALDHRTPVFARSAEPDHVRLNLQIQGFIELYRHLAPSAPPSPESSLGSLTGGSMHGSAQLTSTLQALHSLHTEANRLRPDDRAVYLQEIKDVGGLLAYIEPETSVVSGFLDQQRRIALAQQINAAILKSEGRPVQSHLEQIVRRTHAIYATLHEQGIDAIPSWTGDAKGATHWHIAEQLKRRPFHKGGFSLREYVWESS